MAYLGIYDWGIGGCGCYKAYKATSNTAPVLYFSDAGYTPYGKVDEQELHCRVHEVLEWMFEKGCEHVIIACNAASTVLIEKQENQRYSTIIQHAVTTVEHQSCETVGVIGGARTINSCVYEELLPEFDIQGSIAQPLSALIEQGVTEGIQIEAVLEQVLDPIKEVPTLLLACTHYPAAWQAIQHMMKDCVLLDPVHEAVNCMQKINVEHSNEPDIFFTTGNIAQMKSSAKLAFGVEIDEIIPVQV